VKRSKNKNLPSAVRAGNLSHEVRALVDLRATNEGLLPNLTCYSCFEGSHLALFLKGGGSGGLLELCDPFFRLFSSLWKFKVLKIKFL
jgi:nicotinamidase-related amidase